MYCPSCGERVEAGDMFCRHCGEPLERTAADTSTGRTPETPYVESTGVMPPLVHLLGV
ncbi:MAG: zinc-ribbon domain-containing protein, partial [Halobacteriales archaeon]